MRRPPPESPTRPTSRAIAVVTAGCALAATVALIGSGCGGGSPASAEDSASRAGKRSHDHPGTSPRCPTQLGGWLRSMAVLRSRLAVGVSYDEYAAEMGEVRDAYDKVPVGRMTIECLASVGTPGEKALNQYIDAANAWGECLSETGCDSTAVEPLLQHRWRVASHFLGSAQRAG